jgi:hypothetical protein
MNAPKWAYRLWPELNPEYGAKTGSGLPERRRDNYVTVEQFRSMVNRFLVIFLLTGVLSAVAAFLSYQAGQNDAKSSRRASVETCRSGTDLRIATAAGLESLRSLAVEYGQSSTRERALFIGRTQPPIDELLSQAAGVEYHAPIPPGSVTPKVRQEVLELAEERCQKRADRAFPGVPRSKPEGSPVP